MNARLEDIFFTGNAVYSMQRIMNYKRVEDTFSIGYALCGVDTVNDKFESGRYLLLAMWYAVNNECNSDHWLHGKWYACSE